MADTDVPIKEIKISTPLEIVIHLVTKEDGPMRAVWNLDPPPHYTKMPWYERIPDGKYVPCYVSETNKAPNETCPKDLIKCKNEFDRYLNLGGLPWRYATPVPGDKLWVPTAKDVK